MSEQQSTEIDAGAARVASRAECHCPTSGFGYRHHRYPCSRAGENECVHSPTATEDTHEQEDQ